MIRHVTIKNFKSIEDVSLDLGRCTVFIGANGSGKSNLLEAVALASAAASNKLDHEFLASRGIRVPDAASHVSSAFAANAATHPIEIALVPDSDPDSERIKLEYSLVPKQSGPYITWLNTVYPNIPVGGSITGHLDHLYRLSAPLRHFLIFSPEWKALRTFESEGQILPLGIRGEGLFRLLKSVLTQKDATRAQAIKDALRVIDWFDDFALPESLTASEHSLRIRDKYLADDLAVFDQRSANEGFLYLLFYFTLFCAEETPKFFALDNVDDSLNPRLCAETITILTQLARRYDKQFLATTHQPAVLDGLDLSDPEQMLYVVNRTASGRTSVTRVSPPESGDGIAPRLSESFLRGDLGGLPTRF